MFGSLRAKLIAAFAFVIFLSLLLAGSAFVFLIRDYQTQLTLNQMADVALPLYSQVGVLERAGADSAQIGRFLDDQAGDVNMRLLLVDKQGKVVEDTSGVLQGKPLLVEQGHAMLGGLRMARWGTFRANDGTEMFFVSPEPRGPRPATERFVSRVPSYSVFLALPVASVAAGWWALAPMLSAAAVASLFVSIAVAILIARSIAGPLAEVTRASEAIAQGDYDQHITVRGQDEVGKLADSFNRMSRQVALSHRTLRDFLANVSHELRTPLTSIQGFSQAMVDGELRTPEDFGEAGRIIDEESQRMRRLVDELLDLSRIESGQTTMELVPLDLGELLATCARRAQRQAAERGVALSVATEALPTVAGDDHRLEQVFANLLDNAVRHTPPGGAVEAVASLDEMFASRSGGRPVASSGVVVRVHNSGSLIPPEDLPRVFERFYQVDKSRASGGTGLGLAIVSEIVQAHGGSVEATSSEGAGTTFIVRLPAAGLASGAGGARFDVGQPARASH